MHILYDRKQINAAAQFIWDNNPLVKEWKSTIESPFDVAEYILKSAKRMAYENLSNPENWSSVYGTGGFMIILTQDGDNDEVEIEVFVDANVAANNATTVTEEIDPEDYEVKEVSSHQDPQPCRPCYVDLGNDQGYYL